VEIILRSIAPSLRLGIDPTRLL